MSRLSGKIARRGPPILGFIAFFLKGVFFNLLGWGTVSSPYPPPPHSLPAVCIYDRLQLAFKYVIQYLQVWQE
jgi:hypothetical protein